MSKEIIKQIIKIAGKAESDKIEVLTEHLKITGRIYSENGECKSCSDELLTLTDSFIFKLNNSSAEDCKDGVCSFGDNSLYHYEWLNISSNAIIAFSIVK